MLKAKKRTGSPIGAACPLFKKVYSLEDNTRMEEELLRIFRSLTPDQKEMYIEQGKLYIRMNHKKESEAFSGASQSGV